MSNARYFAFAPGDSSAGSPANGAARVQVVTMDRQFLPGCFYGNASWIVKPYRRDDFFKHRSDELLMFIGADPGDPENLNGEIELWIENDRLLLTQTSIVFVPGGAAHGRLEVRNLKQPVFHYTCHINTDIYEEIPAEPTAPAGTYARNWVVRYEPVDGRLPSAPEGFLTPLLWIDGRKLRGAPYLEAVWFHTDNDTGPEEHSHDFDEIFGFIGSDARHPDELGAELTFAIGDEVIAVKKSCLVYVPRGLKHSPILVPKLERPIIHFSGGNGGDYIREGSDQF